jgi:uncharacterized protein (TIGR02271 family)
MIRNEPKLAEGMTVYSSDGTKLGKITTCRADGFVVEKGLFFPKSSLLHYDDVAEVDNGDVRLHHTREYLADESSWLSREEGLKRVAAGKTGAAVAGVKAAIEPGKGRDMRKEEQAEVVRVPLAEEEVSAEKHVRDLGEVRVHKKVVVRQRQITVPVMHEEVRVERVALDPASAVTPSQDVFVETTVAIPLHEEVVEVKKHTVVREEVRLTKQAFQEEFKTTTEVRSEELDIEEPATLKERLRKTG